MSKQVIDEGLRCLKNLKSDNQNYENLKNILSNNVTVLCSQSIDDFNWFSYQALAHASASNHDTTFFGSKTIYHPFISISPHSILENKLNKHRLASLKKTFFHEQIHNIGFKHGIDPEYSIACAECCFDESSFSKEAACRLCSGNYKSIKEEKYLNDYLPFAANQADLKSELKVVNGFVKSSNNIKKNIYYLILVNSSYSSSITNSLINIAKNNRISFSQKELSLISKLKKGNLDTDTSKEIENSALVISQILVDMYVDSNKQQAINNFFQRADRLAVDLLAIKESHPKQFEVLNNNLILMIKDLLNGYPDNSLKDESSALFIFFDQIGIFNDVLGSK